MEKAGGIAFSSGTLAEKRARITTGGLGSSNNGTVLGGKLSSDDSENDTVESGTIENCGGVGKSRS
jgi:hypothetical protein